MSIRLRNYARFGKFVKSGGIVVCDWDDTITDKDTIPLLFKYTKQPIDYFYDVYMDNYKRYTASTHPRETVEEEVAYQKGVRSVELSSVEAAVEREVFKGMPESTIAAAYSDVQLKNGFKEFAQRVPIQVLSVNWTSLIIRKTLESLDVSAPVYSNELEAKGGVCTGAGDFPIVTGYDKLQKLKTLTDGQIVYIGDSSTDVLSMIYADFAIIMRGGSAQAQLERMGYTVYDIVKEYGAEETLAQPKPKFLVMDDWVDVLHLFSSLYRL